jgi:hypothetical protein
MLDAGRVIAAFDPAGRAGKDDFGHSDLGCHNSAGSPQPNSTSGALDGSGGRA